MDKVEFNKRVSDLQQKLKVPKLQHNKFGNYNFRSAEDILEAVKLILGDLLLEITEDMIAVNDQVHKKVTVTLISPNGEHRQSSSAFARESDEPPKGMSTAQNSGSVASYGLKYALGRLFLIDDTKDDDATNTHGKEDKPSGFKKTTESTTPASETETESKPATRSFRKRS